MPIYSIYQPYCTAVPSPRAALRIRAASLRINGLLVEADRRLHRLEGNDYLTAFGESMADPVKTYLGALALGWTPVAASRLQLDVWMKDEIDSIVRAYEQHPNYGWSLQCEMSAKIQEVLIEYPDMPMVRTEKAICEIGRKYQKQRSNALHASGKLASEESGRRCVIDFDQKFHLQAEFTDLVQSIYEIYAQVLLGERLRPPFPRVWRDEIPMLVLDDYRLLCDQMDPKKDDPDRVGYAGTTIQNYPSYHCFVTEEFRSRLNDALAKPIERWSTQLSSIALDGDLLPVGESLWPTNETPPSSGETMATKTMEQQDHSTSKRGKAGRRRAKEDVNGDRIRVGRGDLSQAAFARFCGVSIDNLQRAEAGRATPRTRDRIFKGMLKRSGATQRPNEGSESLLTNSPQ